MCGDSDFTTRDLKLLSSLLSALRFEAGDKVVSRGEEASFLGFVLRGSFCAVVNDAGVPSAPLRRGELLGALEYFDDGSSSANRRRSHDIVASTAGIIGVLTFEDVKLVALTSVDLHMRLMQLIGVSCVKRLRQQQQANGGEQRSSTPSSKSRRTSMVTAKQLQAALSSSPALSPLSPTAAIVAPPPAVPLTLDGGSILADSPASSTDAATLAVVCDEAPATFTIDKLVAPSPSSSVRFAADSSSSNMELLFRVRARKYPNLKPRRIETDAISGGLLLDASAGASGPAVVFPPLPSPPSASAATTKDSNARGSFTGSTGGPPMLEPVSPSATSSAAATAAASSASASGASAATAVDKGSYNYVLYALRGRLAKLEDALEEKDGLIASLGADLRAVREDLGAQSAVSRDSDALAKSLARDLAAEKDRLSKLEVEVVCALRTDLAAKTRQVESMQRDLHVVHAANQAAAIQMRSKLAEHGEVIDEPRSIFASTSNAQGRKGGARSSPAALHDEVSAYTQLYENAIFKLKERLAEQDKNLVAMNKSESSTGRARGMGRELIGSCTSLILALLFVVAFALLRVL